MKIHKVWLYDERTGRILAESKPTCICGAKHGRIMGFWHWLRWGPIP